MGSQLFQVALRKGLIGSNRFDGIGGTVKSNARVYIVGRDHAARVLTV